MQKSHGEWLRDSRIFAFEAWWPPFWPHIEVDWDKALWTMKRLEMDTLQANGLTKWALYPTDLVRRHPELGDRDLLREAQEFCRRHNFKMIIYSLFGHAMPISTQFSKEPLGLYRPMIPDNEIKNNIEHMDNVPEDVIDFHTRFHFGGERYVGHCPFAVESWLMAMVGEMADNYEYNAAWLDGSVELGWANNGFSNICTCAVCQTEYENDFKKPMPIITDFDDQRFFDLKIWATKRLSRLLSKVADRFTKHGKLPLIGNTAGLVPLTYDRDIVKNINGGLFEHAPDTIDLVRKITSARQLVETTLFYPDNYDAWPRKVTSGWEVENKGLIILAHGGTPYLAQPGKYYYDDSNDEPARRIFKFMKENFDILSRQERFAYCAAASMTDTINSEIFKFHDAGVRGWVKAMIDTHLPVADMPFYMLEDEKALKKYKAIIVEDVEVMSDKTIRSLQNYVKNGGGLIMSFNPARYDERMNMRNGELLGELFDLYPYSPTKEEQNRRYQFIGSNKKSYKYSLTYDVYMSFKTEEASKAGFPLRGDKLQPAYVGNVITGASWTRIAEVVPTDNDTPMQVGIAFKNIGKGRAVFTSVSWGLQYLERRAPEQGQWMRDLVEWVSADSFGIVCDGSRLVQLGTTRAGSGRLLYLINNSNDYQGKRQSFWEMMKYAERPLPVGKISVSVPGMKKVRNIYGPAPDSITEKAGILELEYTDFRDHAVLYTTS